MVCGSCVLQLLCFLTHDCQPSTCTVGLFPHSLIHTGDCSGSTIKQYLYISFCFCSVLFSHKNYDYICGSCDNMMEWGGAPSESKNGSECQVTTAPTSSTHSLTKLRNVACVYIIVASEVIWVPSCLSGYWPVTIMVWPVTKTQSGPQTQWGGRCLLSSMLWWAGRLPLWWRHSSLHSDASTDGRIQATLSSSVDECQTCRPDSTHSLHQALHLSTLRDGAGLCNTPRLMQHFHHWRHTCSAENWF